MFVCFFSPVFFFTLLSSSNASPFAGRVTYVSLLDGVMQNSMSGKVTITDFYDCVGCGKNNNDEDDDDDARSTQSPISPIHSEKQFWVEGYVPCSCFLFLLLLLLLL